MDSVGVTVFTPAVGKLPTPSIVTDVASMVRQLSCTWSPAEITVGEAFNTAVGAGAEEGGGAVSSAAGGCFFLQPGNIAKVSSSAKETKTDFRKFNGVLLLWFES